MLSLTMKKSDINARLVRRDPNYCLVVEFENSVPPLVWHLDLEKMPSFTLSMRGSGEDWALGIVEHKSEFTPVAHFDNREEAADAYAAIQKTLMKRPYGHKFSFGRFVAFVIVALLAFIIGSGLYSKWQSYREESRASQIQSGDPAVQQPKTLRPGVPMSADDVLGGR